MFWKSKTKFFSKETNTRVVIFVVFVGSIPCVLNRYLKKKRVMIFMKKVFLTKLLVEIYWNLKVWSKLLLFSRLPSCWKSIKDMFWRLRGFESFKSFNSWNYFVGYPPVENFLKDLDLKLQKLEKETLIILYTACLVEALVPVNIRG